MRKEECESCGGSGMVEGDHRDDLSPCFNCNGSGYVEKRDSIDIFIDDHAEKNGKGEPLVEGCNYHTTWQNHNNMRFVLDKVFGNQARLSTRVTGKSFTTNINSLIFITSNHNRNKAYRILKKQKEGGYAQHMGRMKRS